MCIFILLCMQSWAVASLSYSSVGVDRAGSWLIAGLRGTLSTRHTGEDQDPDGISMTNMPASWSYQHTQCRSISHRNTCDVSENHHMQRPAGETLPGRASGSKGPKGPNSIWIVHRGWVLVEFFSHCCGAEMTITPALIDQLIWSICFTLAQAPFQVMTSALQPTLLCLLKCGTVFWLFVPWR